MKAEKWNAVANDSRESLRNQCPPLKIALTTMIVDATIVALHTLQSIPSYALACFASTPNDGDDDGDEKEYEQFVERDAVIGEAPGLSEWWRA